MSFDDVVLHTGKFGRYQRRLLLIFFLPMISCAFHKMGGVFLSAKADFRCSSPNESPENSSYQPSPGIASVALGNESTNSWWSQCEKYDPSTPDNSSSENSSSISVPAKCDSFVYDKTQYTSTVTTEWDLVCDRAWLKTLSDSLFMLGDLPGVIVLGALSDKYGRKTALLWGVIAQLVCGVLVAVAPNFIAYTILRVFVGATNSALPSIAFVFAVEMVLPESRMKVGTTMNLSFAFGYILTTGLAYFIRKWRHLQFALNVPTLILLVLCRSIPESARWLLSKGRIEESKDILLKISSKNGKKISERRLDLLLGENERNESDVELASLFDLLRYPNLRRRSLLLFFIWFVNSAAYYGLSMNTSNLGGNDYINFIIIAVVEVPAYVLLFFTLNKWGRKTISSGCLFIAGTSLVVTYFVPTDMSWLLKLLTTIGKLAITSAWGTFYISTAELYPTMVRNIGFATCSGFAKLGGAIAPVIDHLFAISRTLPLVVLGLSTIVTGLFALLLPETLHKRLPETIEDGEQFGRTTKKTNRDMEQTNDAQSMKPLKKPISK